MKALLTAALASSACLGCVTATDDQPVDEVAQSVTNYPAAVVAATTTFTATVATNVHDSATALGVSLPATSVRTGYTPRNTLGAGPANGSQFVFAARAFLVGRTTYAAGMYQLATNNHVYFFGPNGRVDLGLARPTQPPAELAQGLCDGAPGLLYFFCLDFVACALYDFDCGELPPVDVG